MGVPIGMVVDHKGPRLAVIAGSLLLGFGYFPYQAGLRWRSWIRRFDMPLLLSHRDWEGAWPLRLQLYVAVIRSFFPADSIPLSSTDSVCGQKTSALNWPHHRGTATAFPMAAFGLSAFFFSVFGSVFFPGDTSAFLMTLAVGTFGLTFVGLFFLRVLPHSSYHSVPSGHRQSLSDSQQLRRTSSDEGMAGGRPGRGSNFAEPGRSSSPKHTDANTSTARSAYGVEGPQSSAGCDRPA